MACKFAGRTKPGPAAQERKASKPWVHSRVCKLSWKGAAILAQVLALRSHLDEVDRKSKAEVLTVESVKTSEPLASKRPKDLSGLHTVGELLPWPSRGTGTAVASCPTPRQAVGCPCIGVITCNAQGAACRSGGRKSAPSYTCCRLKRTSYRQSTAQSIQRSCICPTPEETFCL